MVSNACLTLSYKHTFYTFPVVLLTHQNNASIPMKHLDSLNNILELGPDLHIYILGMCSLVHSGCKYNEEIYNIFCYTMGCLQQ